MKTATKVFLGLLSLAALTLTSCQTVDGIGRDLHAAGSAISNAANR